jgi:GT2 family glycosyltransferase
MKKLSVSVVIPSYNGETLFKQYLSQNLAYFESVGIDDVIVVDDASTDDSLSYLQTHFPQVRLVRNKLNKGFGITANRGVSIASGDIIFLLNSDMLVKQLNWDKILGYLNQPDVFSVVPPIYRKRGGDRVNESYTYGRFIGGWMSTENDIDIEKEAFESEGLPVLWSCGGALLCTKKNFDRFGGFDTVYSPFYVEDLDLSYRAWKKGLKSLYCSDGHLDHQHQSTIGAYYTQAFVEKLHLRNKYIFIWKNISSKRYMVTHFITVVIKMLTFQLKDIVAIINACFLLPAICRSRSQIGSDILSDQDVLNQWKIRFENSNC